jgi:ABC-2 type transport system permease protein
MLLVLFTAIFSCISIIQDRSEGFLQSVLVSPVGPAAIVAGKVLGCTVLAVLQGLLFLALTPLLNLHPGALGLLHAAAVLTVTSLALSAVGFVFAWRIPSVQGFHAIMNVVLMPAWLLSGALFPASGATGWMGRLMALNPLTYGVAALRQALDPDAAAAVGALPSPALCWAVLTGTALVSLGLAGQSVAATARRAS